MHPVHYCSCIRCECSRTIWIVLVCEMRHVYFCGLIWGDCSHTMGIPRVWGDASCLLLWLHLVWVEPNHRNSQGLVRCSLFIIVALFGVNAAKPQDFLGFGEMRHVYYCGFIWYECSQTKGTPMVWWDASCLILWLYLLRRQPNHMSSYGLVRCILFIVVAYCGVNATKL